MNVLLIGSGGREHAIAAKIAQSSMLNKLFIAPGNPGTQNHGVNVNISPNNTKELKQFCVENEIDMLVVGPEEPLVKGIVNDFAKSENTKHILVIGPDAEGATLEGSKDYAKAFMVENDIPTAKYKSFNASQANDAIKFLDKMIPPYVLKADGLAAGKGVLILEDKAQAIAEIKAILNENKFGKAGDKLVIEEFLKGIELSVFVLTDGENYKILPSAKDYKRIGEGDTGLNTGGMGAISPVPFADKNFMLKVEERIIKPTIEGIKNRKINYKGFVFIGLMSVQGEPFVIEYNVRMGDPETEVIMPRLKSDLLALFESLFNGTLSEQDLEIDPRTASTVMLVSGGYPETYQKNKEITGLHLTDGIQVYHAGTTEKDGKILTSGGRVLALTALGKDIESAVKKSLAAASLINFDKKYYRTDIGKDLIN